MSQPSVPVRPAAPAWRGWALGIFAVLCFSIAPPITRAAIIGGLNPTAMLVVRMLVTTAALLATILVMQPSLLRTTAYVRNWSLLTGVINSGGMMGYFWALTRMDASIAAMLMTLAPLGVLGVLALYGERITRRHLVRMGLAILGVYLLIGPSGSADVIGLLLLSLTIITYVFQLVVMQRYLSRFDARTITFYSMLGMTGAVLVYWLIEGMPWTPPTPGEWLALLVLALISTYAARLAMFAAIRQLGSAQVSMLTPVETLLTILWSLLFLGERLTPVQWVGGLLVISSALLAINFVGRSRKLTA